MGSDESVWPKRNAALVQPLLNLIFGRLEYACASNHHLKLAIHAPQACQHSLSHFPNSLHRKPAGLAFGGNAMLRKPCRTKSARESRGPSSIPDDLDFLFLLINVPKIAVID